MPPLRTPSTFGVKAACALFLACSLALVCWTLFAEKTERNQDAQQQISAASDLLAAQLDAGLRETDLALDHLGDNPLIAQLRLGVALSPEQEKKLYQQVLTSIQRIPLLSQIQIVNNACIVVFNSQGHTGISLQQTDICHWMHTQALRTDGRYTAAGDSGILQAVKLHDERQQTAGMLIATLPAQTILGAAAGLGIGGNGEILVQDHHAHLAAHWPALPPAAAGLTLASLERTLIRLEDKQQIFASRSPLDNVERLYSNRPLEDYPLRVMVGRATDEDAQTFRIHAAGYMLAWTLMALMTLTATRTHLSNQDKTIRLQQGAQQLRQNEEQTKLILESVPAAIMLVNHNDLHIQYANSHARTMLDLGDADDVLPSLDGVRPTLRFSIKPLANWLRTGEIFERREIEIERENQTRLWVEASMTILRAPGQTASLIVLQDLGRRKALEMALEDQTRQLDTLSRNDPLTQLVNRRTAELALSNEISRCGRYGHPMSVACFDIDHFRLFNDRYGRQAGDNVLIAVANELRDSTRTTDICARIGGEEFMVIFTNTALPYAYKVMDRIRAKIAQTIFPFAEASVTFSGGVTSWRLGDTTDDIEQRAESLILRAKEAGRNLLLSDEE